MCKRAFTNSPRWLCEWCWGWRDGCVCLQSVPTAASGDRSSRVQTGQSPFIYLRRGSQLSMSFSIFCIAFRVSNWPFFRSPSRGKRNLRELSSSNQVSSPFLYPRPQNIIYTPRSAPVLYTPRSAPVFPRMIKPVIIPLVTKSSGSDLVTSGMMTGIMERFLNQRTLCHLQHGDEMWALFNQYIKNRTRENYKFWIVSFSFRRAECRFHHAPASGSYLYIYLFTHAFIHSSTIRSFIHSFVHPSVHSFIIHPSIHFSIHPSIHLSNHSFIHPSIHSFVHPFIYPSIH